MDELSIDSPDSYLERRVDIKEISVIDENLLLLPDTDADTVCNICYAEFLDANDLQTHLVQVHLTCERSQRFCTYCVKIFSDLEQYMLHILNEHLCTLKWCEHCYRLFPDMETKMLHEKKHQYHPSKAIFCSQCKKCFDDKSIDITQHEFDEHELSEGVMINQGFSILSSLLNMNVKTFFKVTCEAYVCTHCKISCNDLESYIDHLKRRGCRSFTCDNCCFVFHNKRFLLRHVRKHLKISRQFTCYKCNENFSRSAFQIHRKSCSFIKCFECDIEFPTVQDIANHTLEVHNEAISFNRCKFCDKHIIGDEMMKKHINNSHRKTLHLYKYLCIDCDRVFKHPKKLFGHFFSTHKDLKPYTCKMCNISFRVRKKFTLHVKLQHNSVGFVEFDEKFHVFFVEKKSENQFVPKTIYVVSSDDDSGDDVAKDLKKKDPEKNVRNITEVPEVGSSDVKTCTETVKKTETQKIKRKPDIAADSSDSDAPLLKIRKITKLRKASHRRKLKKHKFVCKKCYKNCYTAQNFKRHMTLHCKRQPINCIKCEKKFKSEKSLQEHIEDHHSNSMLIDTLNKVKERRKSVAKINKHEPATNKFRKTIKKVDLVPDETPATLSLVKTKKRLSVKNFFENFSPDSNPENIKIHSCVTMKISTEVRKPSIVMKKSDLSPMVYKGLKMPEKFVDTHAEQPKVTIKIVQGEARRANLNYGERLLRQTEVASMEEDHSYCEEYNYVEDNVSYNLDEGKPNIPDVAEEVMLSSDDIPISQKIILPIMPKVIKSFRIGTLQPQAPYYKIVKIEDIVKPESVSEQVKPEKKIVELPDGMQLVTVNPLAHLIKDDLLHKRPTKTYYKPKERDIRTAIMKSMEVKPKKKKKPEKKKTEPVLEVVHNEIETVIEDKPDETLNISAPDTAE